MIPPPPPSLPPPSPPPPLPPPPPPSSTSTSSSSTPPPLLFLFSFKVIKEIVFRLNLFSSLDTMKNRIHLGDKLGIPGEKLESIEMKALQMSSELQQRRAALEKMVRYAFREGLLKKLPDGLLELNPAPPQADINKIRELVNSITIFFFFS